MILEAPWLVYELVAPVGVNGPCNQVLILIFLIQFLSSECYLFKILNWHPYTIHTSIIWKNSNSSRNTWCFLGVTYLPILCKGTDGDDDSLYFSVFRWNLSLHNLPRPSNYPIDCLIHERNYLVNHWPNQNCDWDSCADQSMHFVLEMSQGHFVQHVKSP